MVEFETRRSCVISSTAKDDSMKIGTLVQYTRSPNFVLSITSINNNRFDGMIISAPDARNIGSPFCNQKFEEYKRFIGTITITQE